MNSTGQRILRYIASLTSNFGGIGARFHRLDQHRPVVSAAQPMPSSICLVECGSEQMLRMKMLGEVGVVRQPVVAVVLVPAFEALALGQ